MPIDNIAFYFLHQASPFRNHALRFLQNVKPSTLIYIVTTKSWKLNLKFCAAGLVLGLVEFKSRF